MAVPGFFFRSQLSEGFFNPRRIKQRIIAEAVRAAWSIQNHTFCLSSKYGQNFAIAGGGDHAYETSGPIFWRNFLQFAEQARVVGLVIGIIRKQMGLFGGVTCGMHAGCAIERKKIGVLS